jgi:hypothetical protein
MQAKFRIEMAKLTGFANIAADYGDVQNGWFVFELQDDFNEYGTFCAILDDAAEFGRISEKVAADLQEKIGVTDFY